MRGGAGIPGRASPRPSVDISEGIISAVRLSAPLSNLAFQKGFMKKQREKQKASPREAHQAERDGILRHCSCWEELSPSQNTQSILANATIAGWVLRPPRAGIIDDTADDATANVCWAGTQLGAGRARSKDQGTRRALSQQGQMPPTRPTPSLGCTTVRGQGLPWATFRAQSRMELGSCSLLTFRHRSMKVPNPVIFLGG